MSNAEIISSTNLIILLEDEIFADFFNTFLSLPVFGQTPFYAVENSQWNLWPEIPYDVIAKYKGLLTWLEKYRLPFFCKTNLCFHYILCQELISFIKSPEGGEELLDFWILAEKILSIDEMDLEMRDHYLSLLLVLKATHLQEGSRVVTLCNMNIKSLLNLSIWHPNQSTTRREILSHMQKVALFKLQSYWLPNFYTHARTIMAKVESCQGLLQEYETRLCSVCCTHIGELPVNMSIKKCHYPQKRYSSKTTKRRMWQLTDHGSTLEIDTKPETNITPLQEMCSQVKDTYKYKYTQMPSLKVTSSKERIISSQEKDILCAGKSNMKKKSKSHLHMEGLFETTFSTHMRTVTPSINHCPQMTIKKVIKQSISLGYTHWALCADDCAGRPFRHYLKKQNLKVEIQLLDLWQDLHHFLSVLLSNRKTGNTVFQHMLGNRICELYLNEQIGPCLPLKSQTIEGLKEMLPSGDVNPWISRAQREICKMLSPWYDEFLDEEDYWFLIFTTQTKFIRDKWHKKGSISKEENILLYKRCEESLELSQGLANMEKMDSLQWQKIATEDLRQGGSLQVELKSPVLQADLEKMSFGELCYKYPKVAIQKISDDYKIYCEKAPKEDFTVEIIREPRVVSPSPRKTSFYKRTGMRKPSLRPVILQCDAPIIQEISHMRHVSTTTLLTLQGYVMKSLEEKWFKDYQELFPPYPQEGQHIEVQTSRKPSKTTTYLQESQKRGWLKMISFIKSFCKYRRFMSDPSKRHEFEEYLHLEVQNSKENFSTSPNVSGRPTANVANVRSTDLENEDIILMKRRIFGHRIIVVNFAINDLYFFSEMEKFNNLVSSAHMLQVNRAYNENDVMLMRSKLNIILKLYLNSEIPPRLRVNISESQKDAILASIAEGHLDRSIFHGTIMSLFPIIMYFWKRFSSWKAAHSYFQYKGKIFKDKKTSQKPVHKYPPLSGGDHAILRFTLLRGIEWFWPQQQEIITSSVQNSSSSNLTPSRHVLSTVQLCPVTGQNLPSNKREKK
uniref:Regulator of G protein signaling like 1 n=1 Tax=Panthera tigris altaica TaxID=74533 RepID=A0A8C9M849_PANTA